MSEQTSTRGQQAQMWIVAADDQRVTGESGARLALAEAFGLSEYTEPIEQGPEFGLWIVWVPAPVAQLYTENGGYWDCLTFSEFNLEIEALIEPATEPEPSEDETREGYNTVILEEALSFQTENGSEPDIELDAQIRIVRAAWAAGDKAAIDHAVDHLRGMLEISYTDASDLDASTELIGAPAPRGVAPVALPGAANETFHIGFTWTRVQIDAIYAALQAINNYSLNRTETRAVEILLGAIPPAAFENEGQY